MKYFVALLVLLLAGCSHPASTSNAGPMSPIFQPGGEFYVMPGTFTGTWTIYKDSNTFIIDTDSCTAIITEADSLLFVTITNDSNKEVLTIRGIHSWPTDDSGPNE